MWACLSHLKAKVVRALWLDRREIQAIGGPHITGLHLDSMSGELGERAIPPKTKGDGTVEFVPYRVPNKDLQERPLPTTGEDLFIDVVVKAKERILNPAFGIGIYNAQQTLLTSINTVEMGCSAPPLPVGESRLRIRLREVSCLPGHYTATIWATSPQCHPYAYVEDTIQFELRQSPLYGTREVDRRWGCVFTDVEFAHLDTENSF